MYINVRKVVKKPGEADLPWCNHTQFFFPIAMFCLAKIHSVFISLKDISRHFKACMVKWLV